MNNSTDPTQLDPEDQLPPIGYRILVSILYFSIFFAGLILYSLIFTIIFKNRKEFSGPYYTYLVSAGVAELLFASVFGLWGSLCNLIGYCPGPTLLNNILSALITEIGWPVEITTDLVIAIDRTCAICLHTRYNNINFDKIKYIIALGPWLFGLLYQLPFYSLMVPVYYDPTIASEVWDYTSALAPSVGNADYKFEMTILAICAFLYAITITYLIYRRKRTLRRRSSMLTSQGSGLGVAQRALVIQGMLHFSMVLINDIIYYGILLPTNPSVGEILAGNLIFIAIPFVNTVLVIALNSQIRNFFVKLIRRRKQNAAGIQVVLRKPSMAPNARHAANSTVPARGSRVQNINIVEINC